MNKVKPFYIHITDDMTPQMVQDAFDKCVDAGAVAKESITHTDKKHRYVRDYDMHFNYFGVDDDNITALYDIHENYGDDTQEITLDQLDEWLGLGDAVEWMNGDECVWSANNQEFKFVALHCENKEIAIVWNGANDYRHCNLSDLRKPETPEQKAERERLEAAYDLYLTRHINANVLYRYDEFLKNKGTLNGFLAIVDKTNYRKQ